MSKANTEKLCKRRITDWVKRKKDLKFATHTLLKYKVPFMYKQDRRKRWAIFTPKPEGLQEPLKI